MADELRSYFASRRAQIERVDARFAEAVCSLQAFVLRGGKRLRPSFAWWGWRGAGGDPADTSAAGVLRACSALELIQACALVHDDLMDASATRRGHPTVHTEFAQRHRAEGWGGDPDRFGSAAAVLLGDLALAWADDMLRTAAWSVSSLTAALPYWEAMRTEMLGGQYLDVLTEVSGDESPEAALRIDRFKTAAYTVERPLQLGAALAGASPELIGAYSRFGQDVGVAFQLRDDLLGVFGDPDVTGKPAGDDLREGKRTLLVAVALQRADATDPTGAAALRLGLGSDLDEKAIERLRRLLVDLGAVQQVEEKISALTERGLAALDTGLIDPVARAELTRIAEVAAVRSS
ncbi:MAG: polyprenyl synthetase family protein [Mycobacteriaceae bacterium]